MNDTGGPAFPLNTPIWHEIVNEEGYTHSDFTMGMTLRDYFAAKAIVECLQHLSTNERAAEEAYKIADAMLKAREA